MQVKIKEKAGKGALFLLMMGIYYFYNNYINVGGFDVGYQYLLCAVVTGIGLLFFLAVPDLRKFTECIRGIGTMIMPYLVCMIFSFGIWIFTFVDVRQMISGFFAPVYMILCAVTIGVLFYMLGKKTVVYVFWAISAACGILAVQQMLTVGVGEFFYEFYILVSSMSEETLPAMRELEFPQWGYSYGMIFIYFLFERKNMRPGTFILRMSVLTVCSLLVFKRSSMMGAVVGAAVAFWYSKVKNKKYFVNGMIVCFLVFAIAYVPVVRYGVFRTVVERYDINVSNRENLYDTYREYYEYSASYLGKGFGWVQNHVKSEEGVAAYDIHNEYLKNYIELGFWGYLCWILMTLPWMTKRFLTQKNPRSDSTVIGCMIYMAVLYMTENICFCYSFILTLCVILMTVYRDEECEKGVQ